VCESCKGKRFRDEILEVVFEGKNIFEVLDFTVDEAIDFFDWDRSRAWYMDIAGSKQDFIYAISKKNCKIFKHFITDRNHPTYTKGKEKYEDLAFKWWQLMV
jgi:hypothetical protein